MISRMKRLGGMVGVLGVATLTVVARLTRPSRREGPSRSR